MEALVTYYPVPDIPDGIPHAERRFCEQVRTSLQKIDGYGQPLEVHQPFYTDSTYEDPTTPLPEFPVYRADRDVELLYAAWTPNFSGSVEHDLRIYYREGAVAERVMVQEIAAKSVTMTDWKQFSPKRFTGTGTSHALRTGEMLTLEITDFAAGPGMNFPIGLLSLYFRGATS